MKVTLFVPCFMNMMYPRVAVSIVTVLERLGHTVDYHEDLFCCGQPAFNAGYWDEARQVAGPVVRTLAADDADAIVIGSGSCGAMLKVFYRDLFAGTPQADDAVAVGERTWEFSDFLVTKLGVTDVGARFPAKVTLHDGCHGLRELKVKQQPRRLLEHVEGLELIPLVYVNLRRLGVEDLLLLGARSHHLDHWRSNQKLFQTAAAFLQDLQRQEIPALVLKGVALANLYYPDAGCRPMADLDILVPAGKFLALGADLLQQGWKETDGHSFTSFRMDKMPSFGFMRPDGFWVDLHCHVLHANCSRHADDEFWAHAQSWTLRQTAALTLAPEDQLLHVVSHGVRWSDIPPIRWIPDAWWILARTRGRFDWERFLKQARFHKINLPLFRGLEFMNGITPLDLPPDFLARLEAIPVSADARVRFTVETNPTPRPFLPRARSIWKSLAEDEAARYVDAKGRRHLRDTLSLLLFACKIVVRDRRQILADLVAWVIRPFRGKESG